MPLKDNLIKIARKITKKADKLMPGHKTEAVPKARPHFKIHDQTELTITSAYKYFALLKSLNEFH